ncbi:hypothetical protein ACFWZ2_04410 [Streptomyces sp. NPDC059002]|uniref:hypothetical protein n=1 Tax=Streptomyces sp. NPDC059002 TaxID=3346690 RepID=UPI003689ACC2
MRDVTGEWLQEGDPVTVGSFLDDRPQYMSGWQGTVKSFGRTRVTITVTAAFSESDEGRVESFRPKDLRKGHHGIVREKDHHSRMQQAFQDVKTNAVMDALLLGKNAGVITDVQAEEILRLYHSSK